MKSYDFEVDVDIDDHILDIVHHHTNEKMTIDSAIYDMESVSNAFYNIVDVGIRNALESRLSASVNTDSIINTVHNYIEYIKKYGGYVSLNNNDIIKLREDIMDAFKIFEYPFVEMAKLKEE